MSYDFNQFFDGIMDWLDQYENSLQAPRTKTVVSEVAETLKDDPEAS